MENNIEEENVPTDVKISELEPNIEQPRTQFNLDSLKELAMSISKHGIIQPIVVKPLSSGKYRIVAGERRFRAAKMAGILDIPVIVKDISDEQIMELALVENLQREDLSPMEEARGYKSLMVKHNITQSEVADIIGKSRSYVANTLRLLNLPNNVIECLERGDITVGHARAMLSLESDVDIQTVLNLTLSQGLNVRQLESLVKRITSNNQLDTNNKAVDPHRQAFFDDIKIKLSSKLNRKIKIMSGRREKGKIQIEFISDDDLSNLCRILTS